MEFLKKGDRVASRLHVGDVRIGHTGTVQEDGYSPLVIWDTCHVRSRLESKWLDVISRAEPELKPKTLWIEERKQSILAAINLRISRCDDIPCEWVHELLEYIK